MYQIFVHLFSSSSSVGFARHTHIVVWTKEISWIEFGNSAQSASSFIFIRCLFDGSAVTQARMQIKCITNADWLQTTTWNFRPVNAITSAHYGDDLIRTSYPLDQSKEKCRNRVWVVCLVGNFIYKIGISFTRNFQAGISHNMFSILTCDLVGASFLFGVFRLLFAAPFQFVHGSFFNSVVRWIFSSCSCSTKCVIWFQWLRFNSFHSVCQFDLKWRMGSILVHSLTQNVLLVHTCVYYAPELCVAVVVVVFVVHWVLFVYRDLI